MMRNVYLHGRLGDQFGREFRLSVETAGEAVRALHANFSGFLEALKDGEYELIRGDRKQGMWLDLDQVNDFRLGDADFHIVPVVAGSKSGGGTIKAVIGVALIGAAVFFSGGTLAAPLAGMSGTLFGGLTYGNLAMLGVALTISGVSQMLASPDNKTDANKNQSSFSLGGPGNTYEQGNPVPCVYGEVITGSVLISAGLDIEQIPVDWTPVDGDTGTFDPEAANSDANTPGTTDASTPNTYTGPAEMQEVIS